MRRVAVPPAAVGSFALHGAVALAVMISWGSRDLKVGSVVPVTIVSNAPDRDTRPAEQGPVAQSAMTETPVPEAPPEPVPPPANTHDSADRKNRRQKDRACRRHSHRPTLRHAP